MSPRPKNIRKVLHGPVSRLFLPGGADSVERIVLHVEEYESIRLCDYEGMTQQQASEMIGVSRPTLTRIYAQARKKMARALVEGLAVSIEGGSAYMDGEWFLCRNCGLSFNNINPSFDMAGLICPVCGSREIDCNVQQVNTGKYMKKIVLPTRDGRIDDHFGHCEFYTVITVDDNGTIVSSEEMPSPQGCGCKSNVASVFEQMGVTLMLAGNMGAGALNKLNSHGVEVIRGCSGDIMTVVNDYLAGKIKDSGEGCHHHGADGHSCPGH